MMPQASAGLGAAALGTIPWQCWDAPGFKDCHGGCWEESKNQCLYNVDPDLYDSTDACIAALTDQCASSRCVPDLCAASMPAQSPTSSQPWWVGMSCRNANVVKHVQSIIGTNVDGVWGPNSQLAYEAHRKAGGESYAYLASGCTGTVPSTEPSLTVAPPAPEPPPVVVAPVVPTAPSKPGLTTANMLVGGAVIAALGVGGWYYAKKKGLIG